MRFQFYCNGVYDEPLVALRDVDGVVNDEEAHMRITLGQTRSRYAMEEMPLGYLRNLGRTELTTDDMPSL